jgi:hypothetical protein
VSLGLDAWVDALQASNDIGKFDDLIHVPALIIVSVIANDTDPNRPSIEALHMRSSSTKGPTIPDLCITIDDQMVADSAETLLIDVPVLNRVRTSRSR